MATAADDITVVLFAGRRPSNIHLLAPGRTITDANGASLPASKCSITLTGIRRGVECGGKTLSAAPFTLAAGDADPFFTVRIDGQARRYNGTLRIAPDGERLACRLTVPLDDYVAAVLAAETIHDHPAYLEAMAILVRQHAIHAGNQGERAVADDTRDQMFRGLPAGPRTDRLRRLAEKTARRRLLVEGRPAPVFYHACCGGRTQPAWKPWPKLEGWRHLRGRADVDPSGEAWCKNDKWYRWERRIDAARFGDFLFKNWRVRQATRAPGYPMVVLATGSLVPAWPFRMKLGRQLGWNTAPSDDFTLLRHEKRIVLTGRGFGHRVGLCQAGARAQAKAGKSAAQILRFYFPDATVE